MLACYYDYFAGDDRLMAKKQVPILVLYNVKTKDKKMFCYEDASIRRTEVSDSHMLFSDVHNKAALCSYPLSNYVYKMTSKGVSKRYFICDKKNSKQINDWPIKNDIDQGFSQILYALSGRQMYTVVSSQKFPCYYLHVT